MDRPWTAEHAVSRDLARELVEAQFPDLAPARVEDLGAGWDNSACLVDGDWVFRFPRRGLAVELLEREAAILPWLAPRLPLAVPVPTRLGRPAARFPWPFAGYRRLPGTTACRAALAGALDAAARARAARPLARFLAALHSTPTEAAARRGAGPDTLGRLDPSIRVPQVEERLQAARTQGLVRDARPLRAVIAAFPEEFRPSSTTLVHGDLYARHVLVDEDVRPCGVIDWGDVHLGDPAVDLALAHGLLPPAAHDAFREAYGPIAESTWLVARFRALHSALATGIYAAEVGDEALVCEARTALAHLCV